MIKSLNIGELIYEQLTSNTDLSAIVGNKVYPLVANLKRDSQSNSTLSDFSQSNSTLSDLMPFIIYQRDSLSGDACKDGTYEDDVTFSIKVVTSKYLDGISIAALVRGIFEGSSFTYNDTTTNCSFTTGCIYLTNAYEEYNDNYSAFVQTLRFNTKIS